jgi:hypothetical protein
VEAQTFTERVVIIHEVVEGKDDKDQAAYSTSGRQLHVTHDFPIFALLPESTRSDVFDAGSMAMRHDEFDPIFNAVRLNNLLEEEKAAGVEPPKIVKPYKKLASIDEGTKQGMRLIKGKSEGQKEKKKVICHACGCPIDEDGCGCDPVGA